VGIGNTFNVVGGRRRQARLLALAEGNSSIRLPSFPEKWIALPASSREEKVEKKSNGKVFSERLLLISGSPQD